MANPCPQCGSRTWTLSTPKGCSNCPAPLSDRIIEKAIIIVALTVVMSILVGAGGLYGWWAYDDWTCGFKECRVIKEAP